MYKQGSSEDGINVKYHMSSHMYSVDGYKKFQVVGHLKYLLDSATTEYRATLVDFIYMYRRLTMNKAYNNGHYYYSSVRK